MKKPITIVVALLVLTTALILQPGCSSSPSDFEEVIAKAIEATGEAKTYRMEIKNDRVEMGEAEQTITSMEFVAPDRTHGFSREIQASWIGEESIQIGTVVYTREVNSDEWHVHDWNDERFAVRNLAVGMLQSFVDLADIQELGDEKIDGVDCFHYMGSMDMETRQREELDALDESDPRYEQQKSMYESIEYLRDDVEFWIGKDDYLLRQYRVHIELNEIIDKGGDTEKEEPYSSVATVRYFDFNEPIEIEPPPAELVK